MGFKIYSIRISLQNYRKKIFFVEVLIDINRHGKKFIPNWNSKDIVKSSVSSRKFILSEDEVQSRDEIVFKNKCFYEILLRLYIEMQ